MEKGHNKMNFDSFLTLLTCFYYRYTSLFKNLCIFIAE